MNVFFGALKRLLRNPINLLFLLAFPLIVALLVLTTTSGDPESSAPIKIGIVDQDETKLSQTLVAHMESRYTCTRMAEADIAATLSEQQVSWVLRIPAGYQAALLAGQAPRLEGEAIALSDVQALAGVSAEACTRSLLALTAGAGETELPALLASWAQSAQVDVRLQHMATGWKDAYFWVAFHSWISMLTTFFLVRTLMEDRKHGLPERLGVLPVSRQRYLLECIVAVFLLCECSTLLLLAGVSATLGARLPNPLLLFLLLSVYNLFATGFSIGIYSVIRSSGNVSFVYLMCSTLFAMLGGTYWPLEIMPDFMQKLARFCPNYWLSTGLKNMEAITFTDYGVPVLLLLCFTVVAFLLGSWQRLQKAEE